MTDNLKVSLQIFQYDKFMEKKLLQQGEFGSTFVAKYPGFDKVCLTEVSHSMHSNKKRLEKEAERLFQLNSKYIVNILGVVLELRNTCLVMEYMAFSSLKYFMKTYKDDFFKWPIRVRILYQTAEGLNYLHNKTIIHQGLEPSIVMLDEHLNVKLAESGFRQQSLMATWSQNASSYQQLHGRFTATVFHHPPEHINDINLQPSVSTDIYAFGILTWQIAACSEPYRNIKDDQEILKLIGEHKLHPGPISTNTNTPNFIHKILNQCLHVDPAQRTNTGTLLNQLESSVQQYKVEAEKIAFDALQTIRPTSLTVQATPTLKSERVTDTNHPLRHPSGEHSVELSETLTKGVIQGNPDITSSAVAFPPEEPSNRNSTQINPALELNLPGPETGYLSSTTYPYSTATSGRISSTREVSPGEVSLHTNDSETDQEGHSDFIPAEGSPLPIQPRHLYDIATHLGKKWRRFGELILHFSEGELDNFEYGQTDLKEVSYKMLANWVDTNGGKQVVTLGRLVAKLKEGRLFDVARRIRLSS